MSPADTDPMGLRVGSPGLPSGPQTTQLREDEEGDLSLPHRRAGSVHGWGSVERPGRKSARPPRPWLQPPGRRHLLSGPEPHALTFHKVTVSGWAVEGASVNDLVRRSGHTGSCALIQMRVDATPRVLVCDDLFRGFSLGGGQKKPARNTVCCNCLLHLKVYKSEL